MSTTIAPGSIYTVDLTESVGQGSWIAEQGTAVMTIKVTHVPDATGCGFGRVVDGKLAEHFRNGVPVGVVLFKPEWIVG